jgi:hypothetical protein
MRTRVIAGESAVAPPVGDRPKTADRDPVPYRRLAAAVVLQAVCDCNRKPRSRCKGSSEAARAAVLALAIQAEARQWWHSPAAEFWCGFARQDATALGQRLRSIDYAVDVASLRRALEG